MTTTLQPRPRLQTQREFRYTRELYHALGESGVLNGTKVELIRGRLIEMPPISDEHGASSLRSGRELRRIFPENAFTVRPGISFIAADDSEPEPDLCVVAGSTDDDARHPSSCLLLVEISLSTLAYDRGEKASLYAESGVADYWIVNLVDRVVEMYREPTRAADGAWAYASRVVRRPGEPCDPLAAPGASIDPAALLPAP